MYFIYFHLVLRVGCYNDVGYIAGKRLFTTFVDYRSLIDWKNMNDSLREITMLCSTQAKDNGYEVINFVILFILLKFALRWYTTNYFLKISDKFLNNTIKICFPKLFLILEKMNFLRKGSIATTLATQNIHKNNSAIENMISCEVVVRITLNIQEMFILILSRE